MKNEDSISEYPVVEGRYFLSKYWSINLPIAFKRRIEAKSMILSCFGLTFCLEQYKNTKKVSPKELVESLCTVSVQETTDYKNFEIGATHLIQYFQTKTINDKQVFVYQYFIASHEAALSVVSYSDTIELCQYAKQICQSIQEPMTRIN